MSLVDYKNSKGRRSIASLLLLFILRACTIPSAHGQAAAETAGATSVSATTASQAKAAGFATTPPAADNQSKSPHLPAAVGPPPEVLNRRNLEQRAGRDAAKLLLRSTPSGSQVWVDSAFVGTTPMLLVLAPGKYHLELRGPRQEFAARIVDLIPRETREIAPTLAAHYPTKVIVR
jgi:hypothetical protein